jgi:DNA-binding CsgD family transcriptional regulator
VDPIVAAALDAVRRDLVDLTQGAHFGVRSVARDPTALAEMLRSDCGAWVVTGGSLTLARPFLGAARAANAAAVAVLSDRTDCEDRADLGYGRLAVLRAAPPFERFQAATIASRAGLNVWDPDLDSPTEAVQAVATPLSPRERTVLELTAAGLSTKTVARQLGISPNTVKFHMHAAFEKLGVTSRAEAVMAAIRRGELAV